MAKKLDAKIMIPSTFTQKKPQGCWHLPATRLLLGENALQAEQQLLLSVNIINKNVHGFKNVTIPYEKIESVEYCEGKRRNSTLKIVTDEIDGTYYLCLSEWAKPALEQIKELLEACAEEGKFGSKAEAVARILEKPMDIIYASHMKVALFTLLLTFVIGYFVSVLLAAIFCMFSTLNARVCKYPLLKWAPLILELIFLLMIAG